MAGMPPELGFDPPDVRRRRDKGKSRAVSPSSSTSRLQTIRTGLQNLSLKRESRALQDYDDEWGATGLQLLHSPTEPLIDFIFVHGLRGGSKKTWCKDGDTRLFWPQAWLRREPALQNVRIHSFGYNSNWGGSKDAELDLYDFGRALYSAMLASPDLQSGTPIILIGHSMGGLVMKQAYLLARQDDNGRQLSARIRCMFFLATPHRGSDSAGLLNNILRASGVLSSKDYVADIKRNSGVTSSINDAFVPAMDHLRLWSFYETSKTSLGISSVMIVDRGSAVIGHKNEISTPLDADHRYVCKFDSPSNPDYILIKNSLIKATTDILGSVFTNQASEMQSQLATLEAYLQVSHDPEADLATIELKREPGSCEWLLRLNSFRDWRDGTGRADRIKGLACYWLSGQPGAGKSVLSTHITRHLLGRGFDTCYYFFRYGRNQQRTTSALLRSLALQMALLHEPVRHALIEMRQAGVNIDQDEEWAVWKKVFISGILPLSLHATQYWVIDGLDECQDPGRLLPLLANIRSQFSVKIFFASRRLPEIEKSFEMIRDRVSSHHLTQEDTRADIRLFIESHTDELPVEPESRPDIVDRLVDNSLGSFLWADLALSEVGNTFCEDEIDEALGQASAGMAPMYDRIFDSMERKSGRNVPLVRSMLEWAVCSTRAPTTDELQASPPLGNRSKVQRVDRVVKELCSQVLRIGSDGTLQLIHATAGDYLIGDSCASVFRIDTAAANERLAKICLAYLLSPEMSPPPHPNLVSRPVARSLFADYACTSWSDHLVESSPLSDELFRLVVEFFKANVLTWMELVLRQKKDLYYLYGASNNLSQYLTARGTLHPGSDSGTEELNALRAWQIDLSRVSLKFGSQILQHPSSIHFLVPPLCPQKSKIFQQFGSSSPALKLQGLTDEAWDDHICDIPLDAIPLSIATGDNSFAVGLYSGIVTIYQQSTCQELSVFSHGKRVDQLAFSHISQRVLTACCSYLKMWALDGRLIWTSSLTGDILALAFTEDDSHILVVDKAGKVSKLLTEDGANVMESHIPGPLQNAALSARAEVIVCVSGEMPPQIWNTEQEPVLLGTCELSGLERSDGEQVTLGELALSPNPSVSLAAVSYRESLCEKDKLAVFDVSINGKVKRVVRLPRISALTASADGHTLAVRSYDRYFIDFMKFETLDHIYRLSTSSLGFQLAFGVDAHRLYGIGFNKVVAWEPSLSGAGPITKNTDRPTQPAHPLYHEILSIISPDGSNFIFAGGSGFVLVFDAATGGYIQLIDGLKCGRPLNTPLRLQEISSGVLVSTLGAQGGGGYSGVLLRKTGIESAPWEARDTLFEFTGKLGRDTTSLQFHPYLPLLVASSQETYTLIDTRTGCRSWVPRYLTGIAGDAQKPWSANSTPTWVRLPGGAVCFIDFRALDLVAFVSEADLREDRPTWVWDHHLQDPILTTLERIERGPRRHEARFEEMVVDETSQFLLLTVEYSPYCNLPEAIRLVVYRTARLIAAVHGTNSQTPGCEMPILTLLGQDFRFFLGFYRGRVIIVDHDLWIKSIDLSDSGDRLAESTDERDVGDPLLHFLRPPRRKQRHCFVPHESLTQRGRLVGTIMPCGTIVLSKPGGILLFRNALEFLFPDDPAPGLESYGSPVRMGEEAGI